MAYEDLAEDLAAGEAVEGLIESVDEALGLLLSVAADDPTQVLLLTLSMVAYWLVRLFVCLFAAPLRITNTTLMFARLLNYILMLSLMMAGSDSY